MRIRYWSFCFASVLLGFAQERIIPHLPKAGAGFTWRLTLNNTKPFSQWATLNFFSAQGELVETLHAEVAGLSQKTLFPADAGQNVAWLKVEAHVSMQVLASYAPDQDLKTWLNIADLQEQNDSWLWQIAAHQDLWDGIAIVNRGWQHAIVKFELWAKETSAPAETSEFLLSPSEKKQLLADALFSKREARSPQQEWFVKVTSNQPLAAQALRGDLQRKLLYSNQLAHAAPHPSILSLKLEGDDTYPICVTNDPQSGELYIAGFKDGSIQILNPSGSSWLVAPEQVFWAHLLTMKFDAVRKRLWMVSLSSYEDPSVPISYEILVFDVQTKTVLMRRLSINPVSEIALNAEGDLFVAEKSSNRKITKYPADLSEPEAFLNCESCHDFVALTFTPDQRYLILEESFTENLPVENSWFRMNLSTKELTHLGFGGHAYPGGLVFINDQQMLIFHGQNSQLACFSEDFSKVVKKSLPETFFETDQYATGLTIQGGYVWAPISQVEHLFGTGTTSLPFKILAIPVQRLQ